MNDEMEKIEESNSLLYTKEDDKINHGLSKELISPSSLKEYKVYHHIEYGIFLLLCKEENFLRDVWNGLEEYPQVTAPRFCSSSFHEDDMMNVKLKCVPFPFDMDLFSLFNNDEDQIFLNL